MDEQPKPPTGDLAPMQLIVAAARPWLEGVTATVAAFALAGYIALRAHHNWLGIPLASAFEVDRYLMTSLAFTRDLLVRALVWLIPSLIIAAIVSRLTGWVLESRRKTKADQARQAAHALDVLVTALQVLAMLGYEYWTSHLGDGRMDVALGNRAGSIESGRVEFFYEFLVAALIVTVATRSARDVSIKERPRLAVWRALTFGLLLLLIPEAYGVAVMPVAYPRAKVWVKEDEPRCGLLVSATSESVSLWELSGESGRISVLPREAVNRLVLGPSHSMLSDVPDCSEF